MNDPSESIIIPQWGHDMSLLLQLCRQRGYAGLPAHPLARSSRDGYPPPGDVIRAAVEQAAFGFADKEIIAELLDGIEDDATCTRGTLLCAPHGGALRFFTEAQKKLDKNEERGWATGGWELPCWPIRASPYSMVDETARAGAPKFRIT